MAHDRVQNLRKPQHVQEDTVTAINAECVPRKIAENVREWNGRVGYELNVLRCRSKVELLRTTSATGPVEHNGDTVAVLVPEAKRNIKDERGKAAKVEEHSRYSSSSRPSERFSSTGGTLRPYLYIDWHPNKRQPFSFFLSSDDVTQHADDVHPS